MAELDDFVECVFTHRELIALTAAGFALLHEPELEDPEVLESALTKARQALGLAGDQF